MGKALLILLLAASPIAFAHNCPSLMKEIDGKIKTSKGLSQEEINKAKQMRAEGEKLHKEGKHAESMEVLNKAKNML